MEGATLEQTSIPITPGELHPRDAYRLLISVVVPRPIAWVSTVGADGSLNLAPFSFFNAVGGTPPTVMVSVGQRAGVPKDTLRNVQETGEFVVHIVNEELAERMNQTSGEWSYDVDEFELAGLTTLPSTNVRPLRVAEAPIAMECRLTQIVPVQDTHYTMVLGQVLRYHIREELLGPDMRVKAMQLRSIARLGGDEYTAIDRVFMMERPKA
jgi:flavin reductase (DIM6/NTAB) family NADH-FMN oxidoreductase RutF